MEEIVYQGTPRADLLLDEAQEHIQQPVQPPSPTLHQHHAPIDHDRQMHSGQALKEQHNQLIVSYLSTGPTEVHGEPKAPPITNVQPLFPIAILAISCIQYLPFYISTSLAFFAISIMAIESKKPATSIKPKKALNMLVEHCTALDQQFGMAEKLLKEIDAIIAPPHIQHGDLDFRQSISPRASTHFGSSVASTSSVASWHQDSRLSHSFVYKDNLPPLPSHPVRDVLNQEAERMLPTLQGINDELTALITHDEEAHKELPFLLELYGLAETKFGSPGLSDPPITRTIAEVVQTSNIKSTRRRSMPTSPTCRSRRRPSDNLNRQSLISVSSTEEQEPVSPLLGRTIRKRPTSRQRPASLVINPQQYPQALRSPFLESLSLSDAPISAPHVTQTFMNAKKRLFVLLLALNMGVGITAEVEAVMETVCKATPSSVRAIEKAIKTEFADVLLPTVSNRPLPGSYPLQAEDATQLEEGHFYPTSTAAQRSQIEAKNDISAVSLAVRQLALKLHATLNDLTTNSRDADNVIATHESIRADLETLARLWDRSRLSVRLALKPQAPAPVVTREEDIAEESPTTTFRIPQELKTPEDEFVYSTFPLSPQFDDIAEPLTKESLLAPAATWEGIAEPRERSKLSREERIKLAKAKREEAPAAAVSNEPFIQELRQVVAALANQIPS